MQDGRSLGSWPGQMQQPVGVQLAGVVTSDSRLTLDIGGVRTRIISSDSALALAVPEAVSRFALAESRSWNTRPSIEVTAQWGVAAPLLDGRLLFDSGGLWQLYGDDHQLLFRFVSPKFGREPYKTAV